MRTSRGSKAACDTSHPLYQGSPNFLNKGPVYAFLESLVAGMWPLGVENALASMGVYNASLALVGGRVPIVGIRRRNSALSLV